MLSIEAPRSSLPGADGGEKDKTATLMDDDDNYKNNIEHFAKNPYGGDISSAGILPPSSTSGQNIMPGSKEGRAAARILSKRETKFDEKGLLELGLQPKLLLLQMRFIQHPMNP